jgi:hypothetical protein
MAPIFAVAAWRLAGVTDLVANWRSRSASCVIGLAQWNGLRLHGGMELLHTAPLFRGQPELLTQAVLAWRVGLRAAPAIVVNRSGPGCTTDRLGPSEQYPGLVIVCRRGNT